MKKIKNVPGAEVLEKRSFRRWVKQRFSSWLKRQNGERVEEFEKIFGILKEIEDSIEIIAREIARQTKRNGR